MIWTPLNFFTKARRMITNPDILGFLRDKQKVSLPVQRLGG